MSILISALTTGYTSSMISFDMDVDVKKRKNEPKFFGFVPDDHHLRGRAFMLMTIISALHNLSRSMGCVLLAVSGGSTRVICFVGGEMLFYLVFKIVRRDFAYWIPVYGPLGFLISLLNRILAKTIVDFSGCIFFRHPNEMGGAALSLSMAWVRNFADTNPYEQYSHTCTQKKHSHAQAQAVPFVAMRLYEGNGDITNKEEVTLFLIFCLGAWLATNIAFFCTVDLSFLNTFFGAMTAPQYTCERFQNGDDEAKFEAVFYNRLSYTKSIHEEVKTWVAENIDRWREEKPAFAKIDMIPDELLPKRVILEEGGAKRRRSSVSMREVIGLAAVTKD